MKEKPQKPTHEEELQCMDCKKWFKSCICWKSEGYIPKIWFCERCYGKSEGQKIARQEILDLIDKMNKYKTSHYLFPKNMLMLGLEELKERIKQLKENKNE